MNKKFNPGVLVINKHILNDVIEKEDKNSIETLQLLFQHFIPTNIEFNAYHNYISYFGFSDQFEEIEDGAKIPEYEAFFIKSAGVNKIPGTDNYEAILYFNGFKKKQV